MENYNYTCNTVLKFLRKVLNEINKSYIDSGMRTAFLMKRYIEKYKTDTECGPQHVLLCMLKDIGLFYMDGEVPSDNPALAAASSYTFLEHCSPLGIAARPLLFYKAKYIETQSNLDYDLGLLMTILNQVSLYIYQRYKIEDIETVLKTDRKRVLLKPEHVKRVIKLLNDEPDIIEKLNSESNLYVYETSRYISSQNYSDDILEEYIDTTSFAFEFHNHETLAHTVTTAQIAYDLALKCRLTKETAEIIKIAGKVHDIGKIRVPREILCYPGRLEGDMLREMQMHATYTKEIIEGSFSYKIVEIAARHHEKLDGSGYPNHLTDSELSSADKVLAVADICSALYCKRSYKEAFDDETIKEILLSDARAGKLDKRIVDHLVDSFDEIMENAKKEETIVLQKYNNMKEEYEALSKSSALSHFFDYDEYEEEEEVKEEIIYVDEEGNELSPEEVNQNFNDVEEMEPESEIEESIEEEVNTSVEQNEELKDDSDIEEATSLDEEDEESIEDDFNDDSFIDSNDESASEEEVDEVRKHEESMTSSNIDLEESNSLDEEDEFEKYINSLEETSEELEDTKSEEDEFEKYINSLETEEKPKEKKPRKPISLAPSLDDFDPFAIDDEDDEEPTEDVNEPIEESSLSEEPEEQINDDTEPEEIVEDDFADNSFVDEDDELASEEEVDEVRQHEESMTSSNIDLEDSNSLEEVTEDINDSLEEESSLSEEPEEQINDDTESEDEFEFFVPEIEKKSEEDAIEDNSSEPEESVEDDFTDNSFVDEDDELVSEEEVDEVRKHEESMTSSNIDLEDSDSSDDDEDEEDDDEDEDEEDEDEEEEDESDDENSEPVKKFFNDNNNKMKYMISSKKFKKKFKKR